MSQSDSGYVRADFCEGVSTVEFYHPAHNSLPSNLLAQLADTITSEAAKEEVILLVLQSAGDRTFCAGASFNELASIENEQAGLDFFMGFANVINAIRKCGKLVVGRVQGKAVGGGVGLASAVDYCMATKFAMTKLSELAVGIGPFVIGPAVERKIGVSHFGAMAINAKEWYTPAWAKSAGLYHDVFDTTELMDDYLGRFTKTLKAMSPEAMSELKKVLWKGTDDRAAISGRLILSDFAKDTIKSFLKA